MILVKVEAVFEPSNKNKQFVPPFSVFFVETSHNDSAFLQIVKSLDKKRLQFDYAMI